MSKDKRENATKKKVREETEQDQAQRCALAQTGEAGARGIWGPVREYVG